MDGRGKSYRQVSPERAKVWRESPKYRYKHNYDHHQQQQEQKSNVKVPVVYYLCQNRRLEHPHFMEVPLSSSDGLYLRDVIERVSVLRGRGMASMYSWSCKRSYKNGFVWQDLCDDDLILPAHGSEYVLKGSELFDDFNPGQLSPETLLLQNPKALPEPQTSRSQDESSCSSSLNGRTTKNSHEDELSPPDQRPCLSNISSEFIGGKCSSWNNSFSLTEYKVFKNDGLADASTQTEDISSSRSVRSRNTCTRGVSTDDAPFEADTRSSHLRRTPMVKVTVDNSREYVSPPHSTSSPSSSGRTDTLESLIGADAKKANNFRILEDEEFRTSSNIRFKASNMIMQLISCGSVSIKDHSIGLAPSYKPRFSSSKLSSSMLSAQELDHISENPRFTGLKLEDKEYFSGSLVETSMHKEGIPNLKRSSSFNGDRLDEKEEGNTTRTKCIPISIKSSLSKQPKSESLGSLASDIPRISSDRATTSSGGHSKRMTEQRAKHATTPDEQGNVMKIEESLLQVLGL